MVEGWLGVLHCMKVDTSPRYDQIYPTTLVSWRRVLAETCESLVDTGKVPEKLEGDYRVLLFEKGCRHGNYRPLT